jgi:hypothetical protein
VDDLRIRLMTGVSPDKRYIAIRPEHIRVHGHGDQPSKHIANQFKGTIATILNKGFQCSVSIMAGKIQFKYLLATSELFQENLKPSFS